MFSKWSMRIRSERLTIKALLALEEIVRTEDESRRSQTHAVRFALAYLYAVGGGNRKPYDEFWRMLAHDYPCRKDAVMHHAMASVTIQGIYKDVGLERTWEMMFQVKPRTCDAQSLETPKNLS